MSTLTSHKDGSLGSGPNMAAIKDGSLGSLNMQAYQNGSLGSLNMQSYRDGSLGSLNMQSYRDGSLGCGCGVSGLGSSEGDFRAIGAGLGIMALAYFLLTSGLKKA